VDAVDAAPAAGKNGETSGAADWAMPLKQFPAKTAAKQVARRRDAGFITGETLKQD
jgi:hypothetical protein